MKEFKFDGGAASFWMIWLAAFFITLLSAGFAAPFAITMLQRWKAKHTIIEGRRLTFTGSGLGLLGNWIIWLLLCFITLGIYSLWVYPKMQKWIVENTEFE